MPLPVKFDENEWFLISCILISYSVIFRLPKRFAFSQNVLFMLFGPTVARLSDHLLASPKIDLYTLMDTTDYDLFDFFTYLLYAPFSYLFVYFYDKWNIKGYKIILYIFLCSIGGAGFEWVNKMFHVFTYKGWQLPFSFSVYLVTQCLSLLFYHWILDASKKRPN
jgi:hypothetical protein